MLVKQKIAQLERLYSRNLLIATSMEEEIRIFIGLRLREERERLKFSQEAFAKIGNASMRAEQDWERGLSAPKADFLAVAAGHGVDVLYVLTGQRTPTAAESLTTEESALLDNYKRSDAQGRDALRTVAALASRGAGGSTGNKATTVTIGGDVGQSIAGDASFSAPVTFGSAKARK